MAIIEISGKKKSGKDLVGKIAQYLYWKKLVLEKGAVTENMISSFEDFSAFALNGKNFKIVKFADKLKDMVCILLGCTREDLEDYDYKNTELGEEWRRFILHEYGYKYIFSTLDELYKFKGSKILHDGEEITEEVLTPRLVLQYLGTEGGRKTLHPNVWVNATMSDYKQVDGKYPNWIITDCRFPNEATVPKDFKVDGIVIRVNRNVYRGNDEHESETALDNYKGFDEIIDNNGTILELIEKIRTILIKYKII